MANRLLDRQVSLLEYLTSGAAIFGRAGKAAIPPSLHGFDDDLLRLEAGFSHEKRIAKIAAVFPKTLAILGGKREAILRAFVEACPPSDISRIANARQFRDFLVVQWQRKRAEPAYLVDIAACELACAEVRGRVEDALPGTNSRIPRRWIRRHPGIALLRCSFDVRPIFEDNVPTSEPIERDTAIAVAIPPDGGQPRMFELLPVVFELLLALDDWSDPAPLRAAPDLKGLIAELAENGLIEVRR
jgi:hypothetical protein